MDMSLADADAVLDKARLLTFEPKSIIMREGKPGRTFYIIKEGEVEICQATAFPYDPLVVPASYLGTVINRLQAGDYFGERALMTDEPRAASIRATDQPVTCWALDRDDFPHSSPLSGRTKGIQSDAQLENVNDKYGVSLDDLFLQEATSQVRDAQTASQIRGSVNTPEKIRGVDTDDEFDMDEEDMATFVPPPRRPIDQPVDGIRVVDGEKDAIFGVLRRFQLIRQVSQCFDYIVQTQAEWGTAGIRARRAFLVQRLSSSQRADVRETFKLIDASGDGYISLLELSRVMESIGDPKTDAELVSIMENASLNGRPEMDFQDFEGLMAEAEFYNLFRDVFATLDTQNSGFVKAGDLDRVLAGVRDLITDDRKSLIDIEDADVLIDYERFSRMLLGTALI
jgi:Ca2+-binding EF-hand superfamily protein